jgi:hypothetical protein
MLEGLSDDVYPTYADLAKSGFDFDDILWNSRLSAHTMLPEPGKKELKRDKRTGRVYLGYYSPKLKIELLKWAKKFNADKCGWFLDESLRALRGWYVAPAWRASLRWNQVSGVSSTLARGGAFQFNCGGWEMQAVAWGDYSRAIRQKFEKALSEYENASRKLAESKGLVRTPQKYSRENFDWFVLYQFAGLSSPRSLSESALETQTSTNL